jgi:hypothetical protein
VGNVSVVSGRFALRGMVKKNIEIVEKIMDGVIEREIMW